MSVPGLATIDWIARHPLSRGRRLQNLARFASWQIKSRFGQSHTFEFVNEIEMIAERGMTGATGNLYVGMYEFPEMPFVMHFLRPGDVFVDVGANVGAYTLLAAGGVKANVVAFEPGSSFPTLQRNICLNRLDDYVTLHRNAVSDHVGIVRFSDGGNSVINRIDTNGNSLINSTTLDGTLKQTPILIKIDVEGHEREVLLGSQRILQNLQALIVELNDASLCRLLEGYGFHRVTYDPFHRIFTTSARSGDNAIFIRDRTFAEQRVSSAPHFRVNRWLI